MTIINLLTLQALNVALTARQAQRELNAAIILAEIALCEQAQKTARRANAERLNFGEIFNE